MTSKKPTKRAAAKPSKTTTVTTSGSILGSLFTINFGGGGGRGRRRGGGLAGLLAQLLKAFTGRGGGDGGREDRRGRGDVDERLDGGGLERADDSTGSTFLNSGKQPDPRAGRRQAGTPKGTTR